MNLIDAIGYIAAVCTTAAFAPQVILTWKTRKVDGISLGMYSILSIGVLLWLIYGLLISAWPVVFANAVTLVLAGLILAMKIRYRRT